MFKVLGIKPGKNCVAAMQFSDSIKIKKVKTLLKKYKNKCRQANCLKRKLLEEVFEEGEDVDNSLHTPENY